MKQSSIYRAIVVHSSSYSLAMLLERLPGLLLLPLYTRFLTPADYGVMEMVDLSTSVAGMIVGLRLGEALFYFLANAPDEQTRLRYTNSALIGSAILALVAGLGGIVAAPQLSQFVLGTPQYAHYFRLAFAAFAFSMPQDVALACLRAENRSKLFTAVYATRVVIAVALNLLFVVKLRLGVAGMLSSALITTAATGLVLACMRLCKGSFVWSWAHLKDLSRYSYPLGLGALAMFFVHFGDRFFLRQHVSLAELGIYSLAYKLGMLIAYLATPFNIFWRAQMFSIVRGPEGEIAYARVLTYLVLCLSAAVLALAFLTRPLVALVLDERFRSCADFIPFIALAYVFREIGDYFRNALLLEGCTRQDAQVTAVGAMASLGGYAILIPRFHSWGAVAATNLSFLVLLILSLLQAQKTRPYSFEFYRILRLGLCASIPILLFASIHVAGVWVQLVWGFLLTFLFFVLLYKAGFLLQEEKAGLRSALWTRRANG